MSTNCTMQSQTCDRLVAFLKTQKGFIRSQATSGCGGGGGGDGVLFGGVLFVCYLVALPIDGAL